MIQFSLDELITVYERIGSVHKAAAEIGISHSRAHRALTKAGAMRTNMTDAERASIRQAYEEVGAEHIDLAAVAARMGRCKTSICRAAHEMGLTNKARKKSDEGRAAIAAGHARMLATVGHPKGFAGGVHSAEARAVISQKSKDAWLVAKSFEIGPMSPEQRQRRSDQMVARMASTSSENAYSRCKAGRREEIGPMYFRSAWEANYARYLNWLLGRGEIDRWEYEPETFWFEAIRRGVRSYRPDFRVTEKGRSYFVEVKGWMDPKSKTKLARMKRYHPSVEVRVVGERQYRSIERSISRLIPGWEV